MHQMVKKKGFFLQIEVASIDKRDHDAEPCQQIGETIAFDNAIQDALDYASSQSRYFGNQLLQIMHIHLK